MDTQRTDGQGGQPVAQAARDLSPQILSIMTTEHYTLQSGRATTVAEASARTSHFLVTVSTSLIALAFVGQMAHSDAGLDPAFYVFSLVLFPTLTFLGLVTFERVLQSGIEDVTYARGINRIRHLYQEHAPQMRPYFIMSAHDDNVGVMANMATGWSWWQTFLTMPGMVAVVNSVLVGTFVGLLLTALFDLPLGAAVGAGIVAFLASVFLHQRYQWRRWEQSSAAQSVLFPSTSET